MIFVTLGSQKFQFNRLLIELDRLIGEGIIKDDIFAQIGYSDYTPVNYEYKKFLNREEFSKNIGSSDIVVTHGGTGAIIGAVKRNKKVIAIPRLKEFDEHVDNHQLQITEEFEKMKFIKAVYEIENLNEAIIDINILEFKKYQSNTINLINSIQEYLSCLHEL